MIKNIIKWMFLATIVSFVVSVISDARFVYSQNRVKHQDDPHMWQS